MFRPPPTSTLFPYTTLFRSADSVHTASCDALKSTSATPSIVPVATSTPVVVIEQSARHLVDTARTSGRSEDRKSTRLNSSHSQISYAVFCLKKKQITTTTTV